MPNHLQPQVHSDRDRSYIDQDASDLAYHAGGCVQRAILSEAQRLARLSSPVGQILVRVEHVAAAMGKFGLCLVNNEIRIQSDDELRERSPAAA
jgi:hypothetical protein